MRPTRLRRRPIRAGTKKRHLFAPDSRTNGNFCDFEPAPFEQRRPRCLRTRPARAALCCRNEFPFVCCKVRRTPHTSETLRENEKPRRDGQEVFRVAGWRWAVQFDVARRPDRLIDCTRPQPLESEICLRVCISRTQTRRRRQSADYQVPSRNAKTTTPKRNMRLPSPPLLSSPTHSGFPAATPLNKRAANAKAMWRRRVRSNL